VGGGQNFTGWANPEADELLEKARAITNENERRDLYVRFQDIFAEEAPAVLLYYPVYTYGVNTRVHNVQIGSLNQPPERFETFADWYMLTRRVPANQVPAAAPPTPPGGFLVAPANGD
jgi:peptide/nickel transport system substrate-binding protein